MEITDKQRWEFLKNNKLGIRINPLGTKWSVYAPIVPTRPWHKTRDLKTLEEYDSPLEAIDAAIEAMGEKDE